MCLVHVGVWGTLVGAMVSESVILARRLGKYEYSVKEVVGSLCKCAVLQAIDGRRAKDQDMTRLLYCLLFFDTYFKFILSLAHRSYTEN